MAKPSGVLPLDGCTVKRAVVAYNGRQHCFEIAHEQRRPLCFYAENGVEMQEWIDAIARVIAQCKIAEQQQQPQQAAQQQASFATSSNSGRSVVQRQTSTNTLAGSPQTSVAARTAPTATTTTRPVIDAYGSDDDQVSLAVSVCVFRDPKPASAADDARWNDDNDDGRRV